MLLKEHITILPNTTYTDIMSLRTNDLRVDEYIQYGYIKKRDLSKWENNEEVAVKMGMLTPFNYKGKTILNAALSRIEEQDSTSCFEDEDELIPVYVFISKETDNQWRDYLSKKGFEIARKNKSREGMRTNREKLFCEYGIHYNVETKELKSFKEKQRIEEEIARKNSLKEKERRERELKAEKERRERELKAEQELIKAEGIKEYNNKYGENAYENRLVELGQIMEKKKNEYKKDDALFSIRENTLSIVKSEQLTTTNIKYESEDTWLSWIFFFIGIGGCFLYPKDLQILGYPLLWILFTVFCGIGCIVDITQSLSINKTYGRKYTYYTMFDGKLKKVKKHNLQYIWGYGIC